MNKPFNFEFGHGTYIAGEPISDKLNRIRCDLQDAYMEISKTVPTSEQENADRLEALGAIRGSQALILSLFEKWNAEAWTERKV